MEELIIAAKMNEKKIHFEISNKVVDLHSLKSSAMKQK